MTFKEGDSVVVIRGKHRGQECTVLAGDERRNEYVLRTPDGQFITVGAGNTRPPGPAAIDTQDIIAALVIAGNEEFPGGARETAAWIANKLGIKLP